MVDEKPTPEHLQTTNQRLDCYWVGSLNFNFLVEIKGFSTKPPKSEKHFLRGCRCSNQGGDGFRVILPVLSRILLSRKPPETRGKRQILEKNRGLAGHGGQDPGGRDGGQLEAVAGLLGDAQRLGEMTFPFVQLPFAEQFAK